MEIPRRNLRKLSPEEMAKAAEAAAEITPDEDLEVPTSNTAIEEPVSTFKGEPSKAPAESEEDLILEDEPVIVEEEVTFDSTANRSSKIPGGHVGSDSSEDMEDLVFTAPVPNKAVTSNEDTETFTVESTPSSRLPEAPVGEVREEPVARESPAPARPQSAEIRTSTYKATGPIDLHLIDKILRAKEITDSISTDPRELMSSPEVKLIDSSLETPAELIHALLSEETSKFTTFNTFNEIMNLDITARPFKVLRLDEETSLSLLSLVESLSGSDPVEIKDEIDRAYRITSLITGLDERAIKSVAKAMRVIEDIKNL